MSQVSRIFFSIVKMVKTIVKIVKNNSELSELSKLSTVVKIVHNCQNCQKLSKLSNVVRCCQIIKNCQTLTALHATICRKANCPPSPRSSWGTRKIEMGFSMLAGIWGYVSRSKWSATKLSLSASFHDHPRCFASASCQSHNNQTVAHFWAGTMLNSFYDRIAGWDERHLKWVQNLIVASDRIV